MKKLAILTLAALCLGLGGCKVLGEVSDYFAGIEDFVRGNDAEAAPSSPAAQDSQPDPETCTLTVIGYQAPITVTVDSEVLLEEPEEIVLNPGIVGDCFGELSGLPVGSYTVTVTVDVTEGRLLSLQCDPSKTPTLFVAANADGDLRVVPLPQKALAPGAGP